MILNSHLRPFIATDPTETFRKPHTHRVYRSKVCMSSQMQPRTRIAARLTHRSRSLRVLTAGCGTRRQRTTVTTRLGPRLRRTGGRAVANGLATRLQTGWMLREVSSRTSSVLQAAGTNGFWTRASVWRERRNRHLMRN